MLIWEALRWTWHDPDGYAVFSGPLADLTMLGALGVFWRHLECHHTGCHRWGRYPHGHYKLCRVHHPHVPSDGKIGPEQIHQTDPHEPSYRKRLP